MGICVLHLFGILYLLVLVEAGNKCEANDEGLASCSKIQLGDEENADITIVVNICHHPMDVLFMLKSAKWRWRHTFINTDESHPIDASPGPASYTLLHVKIYRPDNATIHVWANFIVDGSGQAFFFNHTFFLGRILEDAQCTPVAHKTSLRDFLVLIIFATLCVLITISATTVLLCLRRQRSSSVQNSPCKCNCFRHCCFCCLATGGDKKSLREGKLLSSTNSERPLSSSSLHSSSHGSGSYIDPDLEPGDYFESRMRKHRPINRSTNPRKTKSMMVQLRNSMYTDSIPMEEFQLPAISEGGGGGMQFGSLGRNFRSKKATLSSAAPHWIPTTQEEIEEYLSDLSLDSTYSGQVPAQDILNLESGASQPHYSATKFHSFRAKKSAGNGGRRRAQKPATITVDDLPLTPESPLISAKDREVIFANGSIHGSLRRTPKMKNGHATRFRDGDKRLSSQHLLNSEMTHSESFY